MRPSEDLVARREAVVCRGVGRLSTMTARSGHGAIIVDADGKEYIDFAGGIGVLNVGHCDDAVVRAAQSQAASLMHTCFHVATYEGYIALCERLVELFPHGDRAKALLVNTGAEAVENAIKIARQATGRPAVICYSGAFHGRTILCSSLTSKVAYKTGCGPFVPEIYRVPYPAKEPDEKLSEDQFAQRELARLRRALNDTVAAETVAAVIIEIVQGEGGFYVAPAAYLAGLREICNQHGIVLVFDEIQSGFGRTGKWAAYEHFNVRPDLSTWAKAMGGGLPIACVIGDAKIMDRVTPGTLGGTYGGNPVACAAALATIDQIESLDLNARAAQIGDAIRARFHSLAAQLVEVTDVRGLGAMLAIEFCEDGDPARPASEGVKRIIESCQADRLLVIAAGVNSNVVRILCPLVITDEQLERGLDILEKAAREHMTIRKPTVPTPTGA